MNKTLLLILTLLYGVICLAISARSAGKIKIKTGEGFFMGGRSLGLIVSITSVSMGVLSGLAFFGSPAYAMRVGNITTATLGFCVMGLVYPWYGYKLWKAGKKKGHMTTADYVQDRYYSPGLAKFIAVMQLVFMIPYLTVQFVAIANGLSYFTNVSYELAIAIFAVLLILMLYLGGAGGVGYMDVFNALLGFLVPLIIVIIVIAKNGAANIGQMCLQNDPFFLDITMGMSFGKTGLTVFTFWLSAFFAIMFSPHILSKMMMVRNKKTFKQMTIMAPLTHFIICLPITGLSIAGIALYKPTLMAEGTSDYLVQNIMADYAPAVLILFMMWALLAFAMSTANGFTISCSTIIAHDLVAPALKKRGGSAEEIDMKSVKIGKIAVIVVVACAAILAMGRSMFITDYAYNLATPGFAQVIPAVLFGLFWKRASKEAAICGTVVGFVVLLLTTFVVPSPLGINPIIWSVGLNLIVFMVVTFFTKPKKEVVEEHFPLEA